jgi:sulfate/thiosulfate transport system permease protein
VLNLTEAPTTRQPERPAPVRATPASVALRFVAMGYVGILVVLPVVVILFRTFQPGLATFFAALTAPAALHAFRMTAIVSVWAGAINTVFGIAAAILLTRYRFWGKRVLNIFIDLPVAVSPIVVGLAFVLVYGPTGWFGPSLERHGIMVIAATPGMVIATVFVSLPLVVRAVAPVLEQAGMDQEQAAESLGAKAVTRLRRITLPTIRTALTYGVVLSLARSIGEYGAVLVVSNNIEGQTETAPLRVGNLVENEFNYNGAYAITFVLMLVAFAAILLSAWIRRRKGT